MRQACKHPNNCLKLFCWTKPNLIPCTMYQTSLHRRVSDRFHHQCKNVKRRYLDLQYISNINDIKGFIPFSNWLHCAVAICSRIGFKTSLYQRTVLVFTFLQSKIEGVTATRCFSPFLVKIELASFSCIKKHFRTVLTPFDH